MSKSRTSLLILRALCQRASRSYFAAAAASSWSCCSVNMSVQRGIKASGGCRWTQGCCGTQGMGLFKNLVMENLRQTKADRSLRNRPILVTSYQLDLVSVSLLSSLTLHHFEYLSTFQSVFLKDKDAFLKSLI